MRRPAFCRSVRPLVHPRCIRRCHRRRVVAAAVHGCGMARLDLPCIGSAGGRLPVRTGDLYTGHHRQRLAAAARHGILIKVASIWKKAASCAGWLWTRPARSRTASPHRPTLSHGAMHSPRQPQHRCQSGGPLRPSCIQGGGTGRADGRGCLARRGRIQRAARSGCAGQINGATYHPGQPPDARRAGAVHTRAGAAHRFALETAGKTVVMLVGAKAVHALFAVADTIRTAAGPPSPSCTHWASTP